MIKVANNNNISVRPISSSTGSTLLIVLFAYLISDNRIEIIVSVRHFISGFAFYIND